MKQLFQKTAQAAALAMGSAWVFLLALILTIVWIIWGYFARFSDSWQLWANTITTIITFLMVFLIQSTQNRDSKAIHLKLDELIRAQRGARNRMLNLQDCTDEELEQLQKEFERMRQRAHAKDDIRAGRTSAEHSSD